MIQAQTDSHIKRKEIASLLAEVPDPEIPVVSIVDLGMVIDIRFQGEQCIIELAPTYSGCPAIDVIPIMVKTRLEDAGISKVKIVLQISPPWSTEWISESGRKKLAAFGIAPPNKALQREEDEGTPKQCPQCGSEKTEMISRFSSTPCKAAYRCLSCQEPFEYFKCY